LFVLNQRINQENRNCKDILKLPIYKPGMMMYICNSSPGLGEAEAGDREFKSNLGYTVRFCLKKTQNRAGHSGSSL
jgi:hypothetical protein